MEVDGLLAGSGQNGPEMRTLVAILAGLIGGIAGALILAEVIADVDQAIEGSFEGGYAWVGLMLGVPIGGIAALPCPSGSCGSSGRPSRSEGR